MILTLNQGDKIIKFLSSALLNKPLGMLSTKLFYWDSTPKRKELVSIRCPAISAIYFGQIMNEFWPPTMSNYHVLFTLDFDTSDRHKQFMCYELRGKGMENDKTNVVDW